VSSSLLCNAVKMLTFNEHTVFDSINCLGFLLAVFVLAVHVR
jgi:hypothetical protein